MRIYIKNDDLTMYDFFKFCKSATFRTKLIKILKNVKYKEYYLKFPMTLYIKLLLECLSMLILKKHLLH